MPELVFADPAERDDLGAFVARAVRLESQAVVRLRNRAEGELVDAWVATPFDALATRTVAGRVEPSDVTVSGSDLLMGLAVVRSATAVSYTHPSCPVSRTRAWRWRGRTRARTARRPRRCSTRR